MPEPAANPDVWLQIGRWIGDHFATAVTGIIGGFGGHKWRSYSKENSVEKRLSDIEKAQTQFRREQDESKIGRANMHSENRARFKDLQSRQEDLKTRQEELSATVQQAQMQLYQQYAEIMKALGEKVGRNENWRRE